MAHIYASEFRNEKGAHVSGPVRLTNASGGVYYRIEVRQKLGASYAGAVSNNLLYLFRRGRKMDGLLLRSEGGLRSVRAVAGKVAYGFRMQP